ncbi:MAG TPA: PqqD family protein [Edaphobacter sp.]|nr:PqqD family protein [Edaphobacter sp.]
MPSLFPQLRTVANQDGAAILDVSRNQITTLNSTGGFIWDKLQQGRTIEQAIQDLAIESDTDPAVVERGVIAFLEQLKSEHLFI